MDNRRTIFVRLSPGQRLVVTADRHQRRHCCHIRRRRCCGFGFGLF